MKKKEEDISGLAIYVVFSIFMCIVFTLVILIMSAFGVMIPDTLITCFFLLFGGEVVTCGLIKIFKLKNKKEDDEIG